MMKYQIPDGFSKSKRTPKATMLATKPDYVSGDASICIWYQYYEDTYAPVVKHESFCILFALATHLEMVRFDVKTAFLY